MHLVLLDLDGTLADTAPDLGGALNALRAERGLAPIALGPLKPAIGRGTPAMLEAGFGIAADAPGFAPLRARFLELYAARVAAETRLYPGIAELLDDVEGHGLAWGVVTNKPERFTLPLLEALGLARRAACIVSGDTLPQRKPDPEPLLHAARSVAADPARSVYLGDAITDVEAARAAGMRALVAGWGYIGDDEAPQAWGAAAVLAAPRQLGSWLLVNG
jgi:phosphoglycolate phosphatase